MRRVALASIMVTAILTFANSAHAGDYEDAVTNQEMREDLGNMSVKYFHMQNQPKAKIDKFIASLKLPADADPNSYKSKSSEALRIALTYALIKAKTEKDAFMHGWAACMDDKPSQ